MAVLLFSGNARLELWSKVHIGYGRARQKRAPWNVRAGCGVRASLDALVFDCDGVILESEDLHRRAYNATFENFEVRCPGNKSPVVWSTEFYDELQNQIGGGKPKMRWYFNRNGWPSSSLYSSLKDDDEKVQLIDTLQDWKTNKYKDIIASGAVEPRPGVLRLMDEARDMGIKVAVCSAATKSSVVFCLTNLLGKERFQQLDCFLAGDDVEEKKPNPMIYKVAVEKLGATPDKCIVIEDSVIGLKAAVGAGMKCVVTFTSSTSKQDFSEAAAVFSSLETVSLDHLVKLLDERVIATG
ncbi:haloacid dehalogenase-like hydrolase domain-containing protein At4g39970 [Selaginella moellendorffii]|uniref:haloacid dehalogenase-like hydrolase domain-containing protein At4g39970 n=1 Tax=Selaginella moellendorffii TaxID=88036 RepID=UPI000D1CE999|nr:haloacid dehalogenase-like hydrolase domain-containing protein At4g39970 [Selaginella moellendorffii]|eukprot:XP_024521492.1 haloacid dehalogenase-like hydrolase domain-containing protein At4g39970 [Selaginella moellendorffii]